LNIKRIKSLNNKKVAIDNNVLIDLQEMSAALNTNFMKLLNHLFNDIFIPIPILEDEIISSLNGLNYMEGIFSTEEGYRLYNKISNQKHAKMLSDYDIHLVVLAEEKNLLVISNDKPIRNICNDYNIEITGTIGIIVSLFENDIITNKLLETAFQFLFSSKSSCYLDNDLKDKIKQEYSLDL